MTVPHCPATMESRQAHSLFLGTKDHVRKDAYFHRPLRINGARICASDLDTKTQGRSISCMLTACVSCSCMQLRLRPQENYYFIIKLLSSYEVGVGSLSWPYSCIS